MKSDEEVMEILEAFALTNSYRAAGELAGCSHHTVEHYVALRDQGRLPAAGAQPERAKLVDPFLPKIEEWVEHSRGKVRADVVFDKLQPVGYVGSERTVRRAVAEAKKHYGAGRRRVYRPWVTEPGMWAQWVRARSWRPCRSFRHGEPTWRAYRSDLTNLDAWLAHRDWTDPAMIADYLRALETAGASYSTIERRVTSITKLANVLAVIGEFDPARNPAKHPTVTIAMSAIRRRLGTDANGSAPLTAERLIQVLVTIDDTTRAGRRDIALLLIGWYGAFRRSELAGIRLQHLDIDNHGVAISLARTKASQERTVWVPIARNPTSRWCPVTALEDWLSELDELGDCLDDSLTLWPWITKGDTLRAGTPPISGAAIDAIVSRRVTNSGLANASSYSAHTLRSGFITEAKNRGVDEADITRHTRLKSLRIMRLYDRTTGWWNRNPTTSMTL